MQDPQLRDSTIAHDHWWWWEWRSIGKQCLAFWLNSLSFTTDRYRVHITADPAPVRLSISHSILPSVMNKTLRYFGPIPFLFFTAFPLPLAHWKEVVKGKGVNIAQGNEIFLLHSYTSSAVVGSCCTSDKATSFYDNRMTKMPSAAVIVSIA